MITRNIDNPAPVLAFLENAREHGHEIDRVIIAYSHSLDEHVLDCLRQAIRVDVVRAPGDPYLFDRLIANGLDPDDVPALLDVPSWSRCREVPYGAYRTAVLVAALVSGMDYLLFFDTDLQPCVLTGDEDGTPIWQTVDFVGEHLAHLSRPTVTVTSSDYSGYYIIPPIDFPEMEVLLLGLCKEMAYDYLCDCEQHGCLNLGPASPGPPFQTDKALGGNLGISLDTPHRLGPFFSTTYLYDGKCILGRGEDTLLGPTIAAKGGKMLDIDVRIFHDTFDNFPRVPDIRDEAVRNRFYRACLGWIGRNPFLTWYKEQIGLLDGDFESGMAQQREDLVRGGMAAARYLDDMRFARLAEAFDESLNTLPAMIDRHGRLMRGWRALVS